MSCSALAELSEILHPPSFARSHSCALVSWLMHCRFHTHAGKMMEEVSITVAYDAHVINQICDEDIFANLVADSRPKPAVGKMHRHAENFQIYYRVDYALIH